MTSASTPLWGAVCVKIQKQMTFTKTRGVYVNRQASCVLYSMLFM